MDLDEPWPAHRGEAVAVLAAGVVAEQDLVRAPVDPTDGGVPLPREPGSRSTATAPRVCDGHGHEALGTERHQGVTRRTSPRAGARRNGLEPNGYGWMTIVTRTLLGQNLSMANTTNEGHKNRETRR